ncbi:hypothetical protein KUL25_02100 [Rhodobacteraceae bacterium N5(2021)]|uniref:Uncharacterized protein n=1 Tax=Gymnodinialimonas phycosphaerae TaxID=2841589 RepID=A0A975YGC5_9RHOB|nr:hypothetical protein [Gymnodinialimonas phycosphaerae]MBY4891554.1 hypothetical protein [Gymnodinialimonas phycosphaerae]
MRHQLKISGLAAVLALLAAPIMADTVGVSRCDQEADGVFRPGLLTVEADGTRTFHSLGENGLTEDIVFNRAAAMEWIAAQGIYPDGTVFNNYSGYVCGLPCEECEEPAEETQIEDPEEPEPEEPETEDPQIEPTDDV